MLLKKRYTVKAVLLKINADSKGNYCVKICVYDRLRKKRIYRDTDYWIGEDYWDFENGYVKKSHKDSRTINLKVNSTVQEIEAGIEEAEKKNISVNIKKILSGEKFSDDFHEYFEVLIGQLRKLTNKYTPGTIKNLEKEKNRLKKYAPQLTFSHVDQFWLRKYESNLVESGLSNNSIHASWKILKKVFNSAIKDGIIKETPFDKYENPKYKQTDRTYLTDEELTRIEEQLKKPLPEYLTNTINYFLLGCYSGLRFSDWQRFNYDGFVTGNRLLLRAKKNGQLISMKIHSRLQQVLDRLKQAPPIYTEQKTNQYLKAVKELAGIKKHITTHVGRHTFAMQCADMGFSKETTAELMAISTRTVEVYYKISNKRIDSEMDKWDQKIAKPEVTRLPASEKYTNT